MLIDTLREVAKEKGMSLKAVADDSGVKYDTLLGWKDHVPNALALAKVAKVLGTTSEELLKED